MKNKLKFFNSMTRQKETFVPLKEGEVSMYVCGLTVYNHAHLGHARSLIVFDTIRAHLEHLGFKVNFVRNITDVDDKIITQAQTEGTSIEKITDKYIASLNEDLNTLSIATSTHTPRATEYIDEMVQLIQILLNKNIAYYASNQDIYFDIQKYDDYGKLSNKKLEDLKIQSTELEHHKINKRHPLDFVLWKSVKEGEKEAGAYWDTSIGTGRPGWHIECSAMSTSLLGSTFDIHGGGQDLEFPHHDHEIAQSISAYGGEYARYWIHNGFIMTRNKDTQEEEKMSKSLKNSFLIKEFVKLYHPEVLRFLILNTHYRKPLMLDIESLNKAKEELLKLYDLKTDINFLNVTQEKLETSEFYQKFIDVMNDDFNTSSAIQVLFQWKKQISQLENQDEKQNELELINYVFSLLKLVQHQTYEIELKNLDVDLEELKKQRELARANKDFKLADEIRDKIKSLGFEVHDNKLNK
jgi:cysteinyl-tRNA synthetase